jgi:hypothetical protein
MRAFPQLLSRQAVSSRIVVREIAEIDTLIDPARLARLDLSILED